MSKTTEWYLELLENGKLEIYQTVVEDVECEIIEEVEVEKE